MLSRGIPPAVVFLTLVLGVIPPGAIRMRAEDPWQRELAIRWSPFIYHGTHNNFDIPTRWDFDGNWIGDDNWEQAYAYQNNFQSYVYYTFQESDSHYFLTYMFFHPRDTKQIGPHENDWEGARVTAEKDGSPHGAFRRLETFSHGNLHQTTAFTQTNNHPTVWIEARGHGVEVFNDGIFPNDCGGLGIWYAGRGAEVPDHCNDRDVSYDLISFEDTLWPRRFWGPGGPYAETASYVSGASFGKLFKDDDGCHSKPPWSWDFSQSGYWFMQPVQWQSLPGGYVYNPYYTDTASASVAGCP